MKVNANVVLGLLGLAVVVGVVSTLGPVASAVVAALWGWTVLEGVALGVVGAWGVSKVVKKQDVGSVVVGLVGLVAVCAAVALLLPAVKAVVAAVWTVAVLKAVVVGCVGLGLAAKGVKEVLR